MRRVALFVVGLAVVALPLLGQQQSSPVASGTDLTSPPLVQDVTLSPDDSRLVRAAKLAVARRRTVMAGGGSWHVDDSMVGHSPTKAEKDKAGTAAPGPILGGKPQAAMGQSSAETVSSAPGGPTRGQLTQKKEALKQEQARMAEENDQPYAGDVPEDLSEKRLTEIPGQIKAVDQKLQTMPPPSPPPQ